MSSQQSNSQQNQQESDIPWLNQNFSLSHQDLSQFSDVSSQHQNAPCLEMAFAQCDMLRRNRQMQEQLEIRMNDHLLETSQPLLSQQAIGNLPSSSQQFVMNHLLQQQSSQLQQRQQSQLQHSQMMFNSQQVLPPRYTYPPPPVAAYQHQDTAADQQHQLSLNQQSHMDTGDTQKTDTMNADDEETEEVIGTPPIIPETQQSPETEQLSETENQGMSGNDEDSVRNDMDTGEKTGTMDADDEGTEELPDKDGMCEDEDDNSSKIFEDAQPKEYFQSPNDIHKDDDSTIASASSMGGVSAMSLFTQPPESPKVSNSESPTVEKQPVTSVITPDQTSKSSTPERAPLPSKKQQPVDSSDSDSDEDESPWTKSQMDQALKEKRATQWTVGVAVSKKSGAPKLLVYHPKDDNTKWQHPPPSCIKMVYVCVMEKSTSRFSRWVSGGKRLEFPHHPDTTFYHFRVALDYLYKSTTKYQFVVDDWKVSPAQEYTTGLMVSSINEADGSINLPYKVYIEYEE